MAAGAGRLAGRALRGGRGFLVGLGLVVALGGGASIGAAVAAHRTDHAYGDYIREAEVSELVVNPSITSPEMDEAIRGFDGVDDVHVDTLLLGSFLFTAPTSLSEANANADEAWLQVRGNLEITSGTGRVVARVTQTRLCRCGHSNNKPFCDGTHAKVGFKSE